MMIAVDDSETSMQTVLDSIKQHIPVIDYPNGSQTTEKGNKTDAKEEIKYNEPLLQCM